jgi:hypothetical protein
LAACDEAKRKLTVKNWKVQTVGNMRRVARVAVFAALLGTCSLVKAQQQSNKIEDHYARLGVGSKASAEILRQGYHLRSLE